MSLAPPSKGVEDPGAHEIDKSDDDSFQDAEDSQRDPPIPTTRVERTDSKPNHGEVPGTSAYDIRRQDAVPDELEVVPEGSRSRKSSNVSGPASPSSPIPKTVIEKVDSNPSHGEIPGTEAHAMRQADAAPDEVTKASDTSRATLKGLPTRPISRSEPFNRPIDDARDPDAEDPDEADEEDDAEAADDFDDFAEGSEDDFGAFDEGDENTQEQTEQATYLPEAVEPQPIFQFHGLDTPQNISRAAEPFISQLFPALEEAAGEEPPVPNTSFLNERSQSLWAQLVAPPPLQPPNWVRSRIRRLFLVSLGVPVDLDEILPASKQKKLILPSIDLEHEQHTPIANGSVERLKQKNGSSASVGSSSAKHERGRRKGPPPSPSFDANAARLLCLTTTEALHKLTPSELKAHKSRLEAFKTTASQSLEYWLIQRDSAYGEKEAFEEVISNFVKHAKKTRT